MPVEATDRSQPFAWWGPPEWGSPAPMSIPRLIAAGNLDVPVAAILWALMHRRSSVILAAMPRLAGKSTLLTAMLDFLPPGVRRIYLRGTYEDFDFLESSQPESSCLLVNELSDHLPHYLWGAGALQALNLLSKGYSLAATMHAESPQHLVSQLTEEVGADRAMLARLTAIVNLYMQPGPAGANDEAVRRVDTITLLEPVGAGLGYVPAVRWEPDGDRFVIESNAVESLAARLGLDGSRLAQELRGREEHLEKALASTGEFQDAALAYSGPVA